MNNVYNSNSCYMFYLTCIVMAMLCVCCISKRCSFTAKFLAAQYIIYGTMTHNDVNLRHTVPYDTNGTTHRTQYCLHTQNACRLSLSSQLKERSEHDGDYSSQLFPLSSSTFLDDVFNLCNPAKVDLFVDTPSTAI